MVVIQHSFPFNREDRTVKTFIIITVRFSKYFVQFILIFFSFYIGSKKEMLIYDS